MDELEMINDICHDECPHPEAFYKLGMETVPIMEFLGNITETYQSGSYPSGGTPEHITWSRYTNKTTMESAKIVTFRPVSNRGYSISVNIPETIVLVRQTDEDGDIIEDDDTSGTKIAIDLAIAAIAANGGKINWAAFE